AERAALEAREEEKGLVVVGAGVKMPPWCLHTYAELSDHKHPQPAWDFALAVTLMPRVVQETAAHGPEDRAQASLVRCVFGNPFRPVSLSADWLTPAVLSLAQVAYDERSPPSGELDSQQLGVLADALEDAGCADRAILDHCRGPGTHMRGCWVVDLLLGRD